MKQYRKKKISKIFNTVTEDTVSITQKQSYFKSEYSEETKNLLSLKIMIGIIKNSIEMLKDKLEEISQKVKQKIEREKNQRQSIFPRKSEDQFKGVQYPNNMSSRNKREGNFQIL